MKAGIWLLALLALGVCPGCRRGDVKMCGPCTRTEQCQAGLSCVNGVCETAPPSCHVQIGL